MFASLPLRDRQGSCMSATDSEKGGGKGFARLRNLGNEEAQYPWLCLERVFYVILVVFFPLSTLS